MTRQPVWDVIKEKIPVSFRLAIAASFFLVVLGLGTGIISAVKKYSVADASVTLTAILLVSIPVFVLGVFLQIFALKTKGVLGLPITGLETWKHYILPGFVVASVSMAYVSRLQRTTLLETLDADYVRTARAKGLTERRVIFNHAWRNSIIPVVTYLGVDIGTAMGGAILTENVFNIPGSRTPDRDVDPVEGQPGCARHLDLHHLRVPDSEPRRGPVVRGHRSADPVRVGGSRGGH